MSAEYTEHQVVVVFDVMADSRESAHRQLVDAISFADEPKSLAEFVLKRAGVCSWWLPEPDAKQYDRNDNAALVLVPVEEQR